MSWTTSTARPLPVSLKRSLQVPRQLSTVLIQLQANIAMGIRSGESKDDMSLPMFSDDILKIEISGPDVRGLDQRIDSLGQGINFVPTTATPSDRH